MLPLRGSRTARVSGLLFAIACALGAVVAVAWGVGGLAGSGPGGRTGGSSPRMPSPSVTSQVPTVAAPRPESLGVPTWSDDFTGPAGAAPAPDRWRPVTGGKGFGNGELECNADDRRTSALDGDGHLIITARQETGFRCVDGSVNDYYSARLSTEGLHAQTYGKVRVRAQLPSAPGIWPAIWALGTDNASAGWPWSGELDIAEVVGSQPSLVFQTAHGPTYAQGGAYALDHTTSLGAPAADGFHVYGMDWTPDHVTFTIDGHDTGTVTRAQVEKTGYWVFDKPFYLLLDVAVGGSFPGPPTAQTHFPQSMVVDYVREYQ